MMTMQALKIIAEGDVASFRYPHFMLGVHLTYGMPPPSTIYGHLCGAIGERIPPDSLRWAYHFEYDVRFMDYEHTHIFSKDPKLNPTEREQLFRPRLTLYLDDLALFDAFVNPRYPVVLGRSQDIMTYTHIEEITLHRTQRAFFDGTLLPMTVTPDAPRVPNATTASNMPRYTDERRQTTWASYRIVPHTANPRLWQGQAGESVWVDRSIKHKRDQHAGRAVVWHRWVDTP